MCTNVLARILSSLSRCDHKVHELIDDVILTKYFFVLQHERKNVTFATKIALDFASSTFANIGANFIPDNSTILVTDTLWLCKAEAFACGGEQEVPDRIW